MDGSGPSSPDRAPLPIMRPATPEAANAAPVYGILWGMPASRQGVFPPVCMDCYARAGVREVGRVLHCPMRRVGLAL